MKSKFLFVLVAVVSMLSARPAAAELILGDKLFYTGGEVTIEVLAASAGYHSFLGLYLLDPTTQQNGNFAENHDTGAVFTFDPSDFGYSVGDELIFGIAVYTGGSHSDPSNYLATFFMGDADRNPDGIVHAGVDDLGDGMFEVGFEDLFNGGDRDYNDNRFLFFGGVTSVPAPGALGLLGLGLLGIGLRRRQRLA